jgi:hypothetical protein
MELVSSQQSLQRLVRLIPGRPFAFGRMKSSLPSGISSGQTRRAGSPNCWGASNTFPPSLIHRPTVCSLNPGHASRSLHDTEDQEFRRAKGH